jgi:uncharacterized protein (TIGR02569 family)
VTAFGAMGEPEPLPGGQGSSWLAGDVVFKPIAADELASHRWLAGVASRVEVPSLRIATPLASQEGAFVVDGWSATRRLDGAPATGWAERADAARELARAFQRVDPATLPSRSDPWAIADRVAWGEEDGIEGPDLAWLGAVRQPIRRPVALVHGDIAGNVLVRAGLPPAVIDLSMYARPVEWSVAVLAVDVVTFEEAPVSVLESIGDDPEFGQLVVRALLFRAITDRIRGDASPGRYRRVIAWLATALGDRDARRPPLG